MCSWTLHMASIILLKCSNILWSVSKLYFAWNLRRRLQNYQYIHPHTHTHTHYVNNIIYICFWWVLGHILTYLKCDLHKFCRMECSRASWSVCFRHVYRWKIYILITLGAVLFQNDEKMWIKYQILYFCECQQSVKQLLLWFNLYSEIEYECSFKFYSHQLMHFFIQLCISLLSYIKIT